MMASGGGRGTDEACVMWFNHVEVPGAGMFSCVPFEQDVKGPIDVETQNEL